MRTSVAVAIAGLLSAASAGHHDHALFHKRHYNQTCSTVWSTWYGEPTMVPLPAPPPAVVASTSSSTSSSVASSSTQAPSPAAPSPHQQLQQLNAAPSNAQGVDFFGAPLGASGMNGITYVPYYGADKASSGCKSADQIASDIQAIHAAGFNRLRTYATDCGLLAALGPVTQQLGMRLVLGIFPNSPATADSDFASQLGDIESYISGGGNNVDAILVANEPLFSGHATVDQIASYLQQAKAALPNQKISVALTHPEVDSYGSQLCQYMDFLGCQIHPFFASNYVSPGDAGSYVESEMSIMSSACGKQCLVTESGYPSGGGTYLSQIAGVTEQQAAISAIRSSSAANHITIFSSTDDSWKGAPGVMGYETMFNCLPLF